MSLCGDVAGDPAHTLTLLNCGLREFSMSANALAAVKSVAPRELRRRALSERTAASTDEHDAVAAYKAVFKAVLDKRPSGMRLRLADALGKNRSFISQISNPDLRNANSGSASEHDLPAVPFLRGGEGAISRRLQRGASPARRLLEGWDARSAPSHCRCRASAAQRRMASSTHCSTSFVRRLAALAARRRARQMKKLMNSPDTLVADWLGRFLGCAFRYRHAWRRAANSCGGRRRRARKWRSFPAAAAAMSRCMRVSSAAACSTQLAPARSSPRRRPTRSSRRRTNWRARRRAVHRQELCGRPHEFRDGGGDGALSARDVARRRRCRRTEATLPGVGRRGVAGTMIVEKMLGAAAESGRRSGNLPCARRESEGAARARSASRFLIAVCRARPPAPFCLAPDEMELGVGIHGEPGRRKVKMAPADEIADDLVEAILRELEDRDVRRMRCCCSMASAGRRSTNSM